jgi:oligopeptide/dipeptide ABC transporter ATP-binding protein
MAIMYLGRFIEQGDSQQIFSNPRHPYTASLLSANPSAESNAQKHRIELQGEVPSLLQRPSGCEFHTRCPRAQQRCRETFPELTQSAKQQFYCHFPMD